MSKIVWSKSRLKMFRRCPYSYYLKYVKKLKGKSNEALEKGIILHSIFEKFYQLYHHSKEMKKVLEDVIVAEGVEESFVRKYKTHLNNFLIFNKDKLKQVGKEEFLPLHTELDIEIDRWRGIIDRVDKVDGKIVLLDYKTSEGYNLNEYIDELYLYSYLYQQKTGETVDYIGIYYTKNNNLIIRKLDEEEMKDIVEMLNAERLSYELMIKNNKFPPKTGWWCKYCDYYDVCEYSTKNKNEVRK